MYRCETTVLRSALSAGIGRGLETIQHLIGASTPNWEASNFEFAMLALIITRKLFINTYFINTQNQKQREKNPILVIMTQKSINNI